MSTRRTRMNEALDSCFLACSCLSVFRPTLRGQQGRFEKNIKTVLNGTLNGTLNSILNGTRIEVQDTPVRRTAQDA